MKFVTRFNPTVNGYLHLGHLYTILVNECEAVRSGGKFIMRFDDTQLAWNYLNGAKVAAWKNDMRADLEWLGIQVSSWDSQADMMGYIEGLLKNIFKYDPQHESYFCEVGSDLAGCPHHFYPYTERLTIEKVLMDAHEGVNWLIRGMDLITEDCLYKHFCRTFHIKEPVLSYIPRLYFDGDTISKTEGGFKIRDYRLAGWKPEILINHLAEDCLGYGSEWRFDALKPQPTLGSWAKLETIVTPRVTVYGEEHLPSYAYVPGDFHVSSR